MRIAVIAVAMALAGCVSTTPRPSASDPALPIIVIEARQPVVIDGRLDEPVWQTAEAHTLRLPADQKERASDLRPAEPGTVRFARDERFLYIAFDFADRDVVQESDQNQQLHFRTGDVAELFLKPQAAGHYWEFYVTPQGRHTAFFFPARGRHGLPGNLHYQSRIQVAAQVQGELNEWKGTDQGWTAEMAVPLDELAAAGVPLDERHEWILLAGRYNYGVHLSTIGPEISSYPGISRTQFHRYEEWAPLKLGPRH